MHNLFLWLVHISLGSIILYSKHVIPVSYWHHLFQSINSHFIVDTVLWTYEITINADTRMFLVRTAQWSCISVESIINLSVLHFAGEYRRLGASAWRDPTEDVSQLVWRQETWHQRTRVQLIPILWASTLLIVLISYVAKYRHRSKIGHCQAILLFK